MIRCRICEVEKSTDDFHPSYLRNYDYMCRDCSANKLRKRLANSKDARVKNRKRASRWYHDNKERKQEYDKQYVIKNRDKRREASKRHRQRHPGRKNADTAKRRIEKAKRIPSWADLEAIKRFYENCPPGYHVDHIIPLRGKTVSGLHVLENLQYLSAKENLAKLNHYSWGEK